MVNYPNSVFLAWQSPNHVWYPVGRLAYQPAVHGKPEYRFIYTKGAERARREVGFTPIDCFPVFEAEYVSEVLFPLFENRVMDSRRKGFSEYLDSLALPPEYREPIHILAVSGGQRQTDSFEVFPEFERATLGDFEIHFFLHGTRHLGEQALAHISNLHVGQRVQIVREEKNVGTLRPAMRIETLSGNAIGYTPNYLVPDFAYIQDKCIYKEQITVARINLANPLDGRVLFRMVACWPPGYSAMMPDDFLPLQANPQMFTVESMAVMA